MKITNNHHSPLNIAGVEVRPGATADVPEGAFKAWSRGNAAQVWMKQGIITPGDESASDEETQDERADLEAVAASLGITDPAQLTDEELAAAIAAAEKKASQDDRAALLEEARSLGLNPNANTGTEKLQKMIAEAKAG